MDRNGQKWAKVDINGHKRTKMDQNGQKLSEPDKTDWNRQKSTEINWNGQNFTEMDLNRQKKTGGNRRRHWISQHIHMCMCELKHWDQKNHQMEKKNWQKRSEKERNGQKCSVTEKKRTEPDRPGQKQALFSFWHNAFNRTHQESQCLPYARFSFLIFGFWAWKKVPQSSL